MKILFCSDGSSKAETAIHFGGRIAAACQAEASILGIAEKPGDEDELLIALRRERNILKEYHVNAELITKTGAPLTEIVKRTAETHYDLVVIGSICKSQSLGFLAPWWSLLKTYKIIESIEPPVLVTFCERPALRRILLCTGGTGFIGKNMEFTAKIAQCVNAVVNLFHVTPEPPAMYEDVIQLENDPDRLLASSSKLGRTLRRQRDLLAQFGVLGEVRLRHGEVLPELLKELHQTGYDLVVSGSARAEERLRRYVMGDATREIVDRADVPVLVVRTGKEQTTSLFEKLISVWARAREKLQRR